MYTPQLVVMSWLVIGATLSTTLSGCSSDKELETGDTGMMTTTTTTTTTNTTSTTVTEDAPLYAFESHFNDGESSVSYAGQSFRQIMMGDMKSYIGGLTADINDGTLVPESGDVRGNLVFYYDFDDAGKGLPHGVSTDPAPLQATYADFPSRKSLTGKIAGNDETGQHKDWSTDFVGWGPKGSITPEGLVYTWFGMIDNAAVAWAAGDYAMDPWGNPVPSLHVTADGVNMQQMLEKFLRGAVSFSQGADDYMDDDTEGKGLLCDNTSPDDEGKAYTALEHAWDEGFGYFGASINYASMSDSDIKDIGHADADDDGAIDLLSEKVYGHAVNAAKRDMGAVVATNYTKQAWDGFYQGRMVIDAAAGTALTDDAFAELQTHRDNAIDAWEKSIASTVVHYINDTLQDMNKLGADDGSYSFDDHAKHWSEMKGFALSFQFNPRSPMTDADFEAMHDLFGTAPALDNEAASRQNLIDARTLLGTAYGFDAANLGDDNGENGW
jgi:hypothetical protein